MGAENETSRKVMVVADPNRESAGALQYALSHVLLEKDELILMHIDNPSSWKNTFSFLRRPSITSGTLSNSAEGFGVGEVDFLEAMTKLCKVAQPRVRLRVERVQMEANNKVNAILAQTKLLGVDILIIGQRRSLSSALLGYKLAGGSSAKPLDTAEYLIEKSNCACVGVQKKGQNAGYLLNTKTHKNFWLLA